ncbi:MAG: HD domain-containing protein, partial [Candidatus Competibacterales bacterium]
MVAVDYCGESATDFEAWLTRHEPTLTPPQREALRCAHRLGNPYTAPSARGLAVVKLLTELKLDVPCLQAALAWEALQGGASSAEVGEVLGEIPATLLADSERLEQVVDLYHRGHHSAYQLENLRKMALAVTRDVRSVLIKLAQRLVEMRHLDSRPLEEQKALALEVRDLFAPLANRLGIGLIKWELEDLAMRHLEPQIYRRLAHALQERRSEREAYLKDALGQLRSALQKAGIDAEVSGRIKHLYSIWRKMRRKSLSFEQLFDIRALRIMVASIGDCYAALGVVHSIWSPVAREFDDYIAHPKGNGYQSLHTAVVGPLGKTVEVQIRTLAMHRSAEYGVAAHWRYKEDGAVDDAVEREVEDLGQTLSGGVSAGAQGEGEDNPGGGGARVHERRVR